MYVFFCYHLMCVIRQLRSMNDKMIKIVWQNG